LLNYTTNVRGPVQLLYIDLNVAVTSRVYADLSYY